MIRTVLSEAVEREFQVLLKRALAGGELPEEIVCDIREVSLAPLPKGVQALVSSPIGFVLSRVWRRKRQEVIPPVDFANKLVEKAQAIQEEEGESFILFVSEQGHINASPTLFGKQRFLERLCCHGTRSLLSSESFFDGAGCLSMHFEKICVSEKEILRRVGEKVGEELGELQASRDSLQRADFVMLLGLLADEEIELGPYLQGLSGRQNIPWLLDKFRSDTLHLLEFSIPKGVLEKERLEEFSDLASLLFSYRNSYLQALRKRRPEIFFSHLLSLIRAFYSYYNQPLYRVLLESSPAHSSTLPRSHMGIPGVEKRCFSKEESLQALTAVLIPAVKEGFDALQWE